MKKAIVSSLAFLLASALPLVVGPMPAAMADYSVTVDPGIQFQTLEGWGGSLAWWANAVGGWADPTRTNLVDALFDSNSGLGLTIARYNIGGGDCPTCTTIPYPRAVPGYEPSNGTYDWTQDANQRWVLQRAIADGVNVVDAVSYSAPYWMTISGSSTGAVDGGNNLSSSYYSNFASYLSNVVQHFSTSWGINLRTVEPVNEPSSSWWKKGGAQEGMHVDPSIQDTLVQDLGADLATAGVTTTVSASDENSIDTAIGTINSFGSTAKSYTSQINTHSYNGSDRLGLYFTANKYAKKLWQSEWGDSNDTSGQGLSNQILSDMKNMMPVSWSFWQPDWPGLINIDYTNHAYTLNEAYYVMGNYSKFIRPGYQFVAINDLNSLAAYDHSTNRLVIVTQNWGTTDTNVTYDLSRFSGISGSAVPYRTSSTENLVELSGIPVVNGSFTATAKAGSVTTFVIDGASYAPAGVASVNDNTTGTGTNQFNYSGSWSYYGSQTGAYMNDNHWSATKNDYYTLQFTGSQAIVYGSKAPNDGIAAISIDGGSETDVDLYASTRSDNIFLYATPTYSGGTHTIKVRVTGRKNSASTSTVVPADRIDIVPWNGFDANGYYRVVNRNSGKDLEVNGASTVDAANVDQYHDVPGALNELWKIMSVGSGYYKIVNVNSGKDLEVYQASAADSANVDQYHDVAGATNEHWSINDAGAGFYKVVNQNSGKDLEVNSAATTDTANVDQYHDVAGAQNEQWTIMKVQ